MTAKATRADILSPESIKTLLDADKCPECLGELDTGYECLKCQYDALPLVNKYAARATEKG